MTRSPEDEHTGMFLLDNRSGAAVIVKERLRQELEEGYTLKRDKNRHDELMRAAECYLLAAQYHWTAWQSPEGNPVPPAPWPWPDRFWKPTEDKIGNLKKAGALTAAAIDSLGDLT